MSFGAPPPDHAAARFSAPRRFAFLGLVATTCVCGWAVAALAQDGPPSTAPAVVSPPAAEEAEPNISEDLREDVLDWIEQLDSSTLSRRKVAERNLIDAGPDILSLLPESISGSVEAQARLLRVKEALLEAKAKSDQKDGTIRVRLAGATNIGEALEAISRDSKIEFEYEGDKSIPFRPVATPLLFWHAVDLVLDAANLDINFYGGDQETLALIRRAEGRRSRVDSAAYTGVYRIEPTAVAARRTLNQPELGGLNITLEVAWEPTLTPIGLTIPVKELAGKLSDQAKLVPQQSGESIEIATNNDLAFSEFYLPMELPTGQPDKIASLSGFIRGLIPGKLHDFRLPLSKVGSQKKIDAMTVSVEEVRQNDSLHEVRVGVELANARRSLESHRHWIFENDVHLERPDGSRIEHLGLEVYRQSSSGVGVGYLFELSQAPDQLTLVYRSPTAVVENEVPFLIQDIPLP